MLTETRAGGTFETILTRLGERHELSAYCAIERLVQAGEAVGISVETLVRLLDRGMTFAELLELIEAKMNVPPQAA